MSSKHTAMQNQSPVEIASREIHLSSRPKGWPTLDNFNLVETKVPAPGEGEVRVRNLFMSVDPYMRGRMREAKSYVPPFQVGNVLEGSAVGEVLESRIDSLLSGDIVTSMMGWREYFVCNERSLRKVDRNVRPLSAYLGILGMPGMSAWVGLNLVDVKGGDVVFVSAAAGAVGSIAGQLAKQRGCKVIGSAGSTDKVKTLIEDLGFDTAFNYKEGGIYAQLKKAAPEGIDVYFDNVGGEHLEAALSVMRVNGRIIACGSVSMYNEEVPPPGPRNLSLFTSKRLTMKGFIVTDWFQQMPQFLKQVGALWSDGKLKMKETVVEGIDNAPHAFLDMLRGGNVGKMIVKLATQSPAPTRAK
jgi:NADPH-dependent curcumin reductase CurA